MTSPVLKFYKVDALPGVLDTDAIYLVKTSAGFDMFVTDHTTAVASGLGSTVLQGTVIELVNEEATAVKKGQVVYTDGTGFKLSLNGNANCKMTIGMVVFDAAAGASVLVQTGGIMKFTNAEWLAATGIAGGIVAAPYWLGAAAGTLTLTPPDGTVDPSWSLKMGLGINNTSFALKIGQPVKL